MISVISGFTGVSIITIIILDKFHMYDKVDRRKMTYVYVGILFLIHCVSIAQTYFSCNYINYPLLLPISLIIPFASMVLFSCFILLSDIGISLKHWLNPFSNTFGYFVAILCGLRTLTDVLFKNAGDSSSPENDVLRRIHTDSTLIINTITPNTIKEFIEKMDAVLNKGDDDKNIKRLKVLVNIKHDVAFIVWIGLVAMIAYAAGNNYILSTDCNPSKKLTGLARDELEDSSGI